MTHFHTNVFLYTDHWTVLMASTTASANEDKIACCVELLLSRNADPNMADRWGATGEGRRGIKMFIGYSAQYALSHPCWCRPNKNTPDLTWTREKKKSRWIKFPLMVLVMFSCHVVALWAPHCSIQCVYICVFCLECPVMACACTDGYQTDRQTNTECKGWAGRF